MINNEKKNQQSDESARAVTNTEIDIESLKARVTALETLLSGGLTSSAYYVCNNDATYDATNSKVLTIENGIIKSVT
jgi:hypothetical protein